MRKGYGPTGISFPYSFEDFEQDLEQLRQEDCMLLVETVIGDQRYRSEFCPDISPTEARVLFDRLDCVVIAFPIKIYELYVK